MGQLFGSCVDIVNFFCKGSKCLLIGVHAMSGLSGPIKRGSLLPSFVAGKGWGCGNSAGLSADASVLASVLLGCSIAGCAIVGAGEAVRWGVSVSVARGVGAK